MLAKLKEYFKKHKRQSATAVVLIVGAIVYCVCGQDIDVQQLVDKICTIISCE